MLIPYKLPESIEYLYKLMLEKREGSYLRVLIFLHSSAMESRHFLTPWIFVKYWGSIWKQHMYVCFSFILHLFIIFFFLSTIADYSLLYPTVSRCIPLKPHLVEPKFSSTPRISAGIVPIEKLNKQLGLLP